MKRADELLKREGIKRDPNLDLLLAAFDEEGDILACGGLFRNTLRCLCVDSAHQGEGILNELVSRLIALQAERGIFHLFLCTKPDTAHFLGSLGFYEIARDGGRLVFMENRRGGFSAYLEKLKKESEGLLPEGGGCVSHAIVMNANPFTLGHRYLCEKAASECDLLHVFVLSEELSLFSFKDRFGMVKAGTEHIKNLVLHETSSYMISAATFPSYFLKGEEEVARAQAELDAEVFSRIAEALDISARWVGEEPLSETTRLYNSVLSEALPKKGIALNIVPRKETDGEAISASRVREALKTGNTGLLKKLLPASSLEKVLKQ